MAKISAMTAATTVADADLVPIVQGGVNKRASRALVRAVLAAVKAADESITSDVTPQADDALTFNVGVKKYIVEGFVKVVVGAGGLKLGFNGTAVLDNMLVGGIGSSPALAVLTDFTALAVYQSVNNTGWFLTGTIEVNTAGTFALYWSQSASNVAATTVKRGSWMRLTEQST